MATIGNLVVKLGADPSGFERGLNRGRGMAKSFVASTAKLIGGAAVTGLAAAGGAAATVAVQTKKAFGDIDEISKYADVVGVSTEFLTGMRHAADQTGTSQSTLTKLFQRNARVLGEATNGNRKHIESYEAIGLSVDRLSQMNPEEAFLKTAQAISEIPDANQRAAASYSIFGRQALEATNLFLAGEDGLRGYIDQADKLGLSFNRVDGAAIEAANDAMDRLGKLLTAIGRKVAIEVAPFLEAGVTTIVDMATAGDGFGAKIEAAMRLGGRAIGVVIDAVDSLRIGWLFARRGVSQFAAFTVDKLAKAAEAIDAFGERLGLSRSKTTDLLVALADELDKVAADDAKTLDEALVGPSARERIDRFFDDVRDKARAAGENVARSMENVVMTPTFEPDVSAADKALEEHEKRLDALAKSVIADTRTPVEILRQELTDLDTLLQTGRIDQQTFDRAAGSANDTILTATGAGIDTPAATAGGPAAINARSQEAYRQTALLIRGSVEDREAKQTAANTETMVTLLTEIRDGNVIAGEPDIGVAEIVA
ncbi:MAG: hypothetical protein AAF532_02165 [Planctomycetota bacterium]